MMCEFSVMPRVSELWIRTYWCSDPGIGSLELIFAVNHSAG